MTYFGYLESDFIPCEICGDMSNDIHHIEYRSHFGKKCKDVQDNILNLMGLCRQHHDNSHDNKISKEQLKIIHKNFINKWKH